MRALIIQLLVMVAFTAGYAAPDLLVTEDGTMVGVVTKSGLQRSALLGVDPSRLKSATLRRLFQVSLSELISDVPSLQTSVSSWLDEDNPVARQLHLYPNPANHSVVIQFAVSAPGRVRVSIWNPLGQQVRALVDASFSAGTHQLSWDGRTQSGFQAGNGVYFIRFETEKTIRTQKLLMLK